MIRKKGELQIGNFVSAIYVVNACKANGSTHLSVTQQEPRLFVLFSYTWKLSHAAGVPLGRNRPGLLFKTREWTFRSDSDGSCRPTVNSPNPHRDRALNPLRD